MRFVRKEMHQSSGQDSRKALEGFISEQFHSVTTPIGDSSKTVVNVNNNDFAHRCTKMMT